MAHTLLTGRRRFERRMAVVAGQRAEAADLLEQGDAQKVFTAHEQATERPVVFLFPGQGAQYAGMTRGLYDGEPSFRKDVDACAERLRAPWGWTCGRVLYPEEAGATRRGSNCGRPRSRSPRSSWSSTPWPAFS